MINALANYLTNCVKEKIPGCVCWVSNNKKVFFFESFGYRQLIPEKIAMHKNTIFDLASITKPLCTAVSVMLLFEEKEIKLTDRIEKYLREFKNKPNGKKTIKELLTHTSGLPAWFPLYLLAKKKRTEYLSTANINKKAMLYSCLGYIILGEIIEKITKLKLEQYCKQKIFKKLEFKNTMFEPVKNIITNIAATELGNEHEKIKASEYGDISKVKWRNYLIKGEVHDGNCFYGYNGVSGNAGLFSNADDLAQIMRFYLAGDIVKMSSIKMMIKDYTGGPEQRGLGWWINSYPGILSPHAFGHTGFTGTMLMVDPELKLIIILLANSVHPKVRLGIMPRIRKRVIEIITNKLGAKL